MSISFSNRAIAAGLALAVALWLSGAALFVPAAQAVTIEELQAQIAALTAQLAALTGGTGTCFSFTRDLYGGLSGNDVEALQDYLTGTGHFSYAGGSTGYFGPVTQAAVAAWQAANGVAPAVGYFGPISRAKYTTVCGGGDDDTTDESDDLSGGAGSISDADFLAGLNNEEVGEDEEDVEIAGLRVEAEGSDIAITAVTLDFDYADTLASNNLNDYVTEVSVWLDGEEFARIDVDDFDEDDGYVKTVALDSGAVIDEDETGDLTVAVTGVSNIDSADESENWNVAFESVRFRDAQDATITDSSTGDITDGNDDTTTDAGERGFTVETFATSADLEVQISDGDDAINDAHVIEVSTSDETSNVDILSFEVEVEGDADVTVNDLVVEFAVVGVSNLDDFVSGVTLWMEGDEVGSENPAAADETITFDDVNLELAAGETYEFLVKVDILAADGTTLNEGDTLRAFIGSTERGLWDVEDENGDDVAAADKTGTATGEASAVYETGVFVTLVSVDADDAPELTAQSIDEQGTFTIVFDVEAFGGNIYVMNGASEDTAPAVGDTFGAAYDIVTSTALGLGTESVNFTSTATEDTTNNNFAVGEGDTETFTLQVVVPVTTGTNGHVEVEFEGLVWGTNDASSGTGVYTFDLAAFQSGSVHLSAF